MLEKGGPGSMCEELFIPPLNFAMVDKGVYRSGYPNKRNLTFLNKLGLRSVVSWAHHPGPALLRAGPAQLLGTVRVAHFLGKTLLEQRDYNAALGLEVEVWVGGREEVEAVAIPAAAEGLPGRHGWSSH
ncbi:hypothetical protein CBR_g23883 [Chara braunii]|uniref:Uncharacterized protein n=1 Tax=Chara braunii TaxID=69332 RepID=A0A388L555_CHABU|nr:hypothetical protein CBR_g23883 [Chara braunii]|eukprot:GBG77434.1 hypothetical protein CBR_g23883 [Chara braunii]